MTEVEETMLRLTPEQKKKIEELSIKYTPMINDIFAQLSEMSPNGTFKWSSMYGTAVFFLGGL